MKKIATATIATAGIATFAFMQQDAQAAENNNGGYNPNDPTSYSYSYTIDENGNYHYTWEGNWSPDQLESYNYDNYDYGYDNYGSYNYAPQSFSPRTTGGKGATYATSDRNINVTTTSAPSNSSKGTRSVSSSHGSANNLYTAGQCTWYVFDRVGGSIGSTWGNASNWANAAAASGYTVNNKPKSGAILQTSQGAYGHVAYVESVNNDGSITVSEMNYAGGPFNTSKRTISAGEAGSYNYIH